MHFPEQIAKEADSEYDFGSLASSRDCSASKFHSPTPLIVNRHVLNPEWFQTIRPGDKYHGDHIVRWLCATCADNLNLYLQLLNKNAGDLAWDIRREFGNLVRTLGDEAWAQHVKLKRIEERIYG